MLSKMANASLTKPAASFRARLGDPVLTQILDHWCGLSAQAGGRTPSRGEFDPVAIPKLLRHLQLHQREATGRYRCRLSGTAIVQQLGRDATGLYLDEAIRAEAVPGRMRIYNRALETGRPVAYSGVMEIPGRGFKAYKRLLLPLTDAAGRPAYVLSAMIFKSVGPMDARKLDEAREIAVTPQIEIGRRSAPAAGIAVAEAA